MEQRTVRNCDKDRLGVCVGVSLDRRVHGGPTADQARAPPAVAVSMLR